MNERDRLRIFGKPKIIPPVREIKSIPEQKIPISIIITAWNVSNFIEECLDSVENQTYFINNDNYEVLVGIDGCQDTLNKLLEIRHKYRNLSIFMMNSNMGTYVTTNTLLDLVKYENILRFDSDDVMMPEMINEIMYYVKDYDIIRFSFYNFETKINNAYYGDRNIPSSGVVLFKKFIFNCVGGYQAWKCAGDDELMSRAKKIPEVKIKRIMNHLFFRRLHDNNLTKRKDTKHGSSLRQYYKNLIEKMKDIKIDKITNTYVEY